jgi:hypothetical protein
MTAPRALGSRPPEEALVILLPCGVDEIVPGALSLIEAICASDRRLSVVVVVPRRDQAEAAARRFPVAFVHVAGWGLSGGRAPPPPRFCGSRRHGPRCPRVSAGCWRARGGAASRPSG